MTCIQCPQGCALEITLAGDKVGAVAGNTCPRGEAYARQEVEHPMRTLATSVKTSGLSLKMLPVRTSGPIPKASLTEAMSAVKKLLVKTPMRTDEAVVRDFLGLGVDLIACRPVDAK